MDGSTAAFIAIPIVTTLALAGWLLLVAYAATHPQWKHGTAAPGPGNPAPVDGHLGSAGPRLAGLAPHDASLAARRPDNHASRSRHDAHV
jgi:hypothetical protein